jgi:hypothetical protein
MKSFLKAAPELRNGYKDRKRLAQVAMLGCIVCQKFNLKQRTRSEVHHLIGCGIGKKASDLKTINLCAKHHRTGENGEAIHATPLNFWQEKFGSQEELLELTNKILENF